MFKRFKYFTNLMILIVLECVLFAMQAFYIVVATSSLK